MLGPESRGGNMIRISLQSSYVGRLTVQSYPILTCMHTLDAGRRSIGSSGCWLYERCPDVNADLIHCYISRVIICSTSVGSVRYIQGFTDSFLSERFCLGSRPVTVTVFLSRYIYRDPNQTTEICRRTHTIILLFKRYILRSLPLR